MQLCKFAMHNSISLHWALAVQLAVVMERIALVGLGLPCKFRGIQLNFMTSHVPDDEPSNIR